MSKLFSTVLVTLLSILQSMAQGNSIPVINQQQEFKLRSRINNTDYQLFVSLPKNYSKTDTTKYPVFYLLDGNYAFPVAHSARTLLDFAGGLEDVIIVGIGYTWETSYEPWYTGRWRDYTPTADVTKDTSSNFLSFLNLKSGALHSGGAQVFMQVLKTEIIPFIEKRFKVNGDKGIGGHSFGGLFATYSLLQEPGLFNRYAITSPSLWWDNGKMFDVEKKFAADHRDLKARVFLSVGSKESSSMVPKIKAFDDSLRAHSYTGLSLTSQVFEDENHFSVLPATMSRALLVLYGANKK